MTVSYDPAGWYEAADPDGGSKAEAGPACAFCGETSGPWAMHARAPAITPRAGAANATKPAACPLCVLPQHLERPRIDDEVALVWLPELSQAALNTVMREIHIALHALGEDVQADAVFRKRSTDHRDLYYARAILSERSPPAVARVGTASPRELGQALLELSPPAAARRAELLGGLRLMPLGRFFRHDRDVYPEIVAFWRNGTHPPPTMPEGKR